MDDQKRLDALRFREDRARIIRDFCNHPGFQILKKKIEDKIEDSKHKWLAAKTSQEAEALRLQTQPWNEIYTMLITDILQGDAASVVIDNLTNQPSSDLGTNKA